SYGGEFITMRALTINTKTEDYVQFAESLGIPKRRIVLKYVIRNCLLPRVTGLAISLGGIFTGALAMEVIFTYPGLGMLLYNAVLNGDYNLIMGICIYSILGIAFAALLLDLLYPLVDPRIRYR
ncbi:MAG: ABC transporter permease, partial [Candidatus Bathyarchaeia archaeon]